MEIRIAASLAVKRAGAGILCINCICGYIRIIPAFGRLVGLAVDDRTETPLLRLYARLPAAELYRSDAYAVALLVAYWTAKFNAGLY